MFTEIFKFKATQSFLHCRNTAFDFHQIFLADKNDDVWRIRSPPLLPCVYISVRSYGYPTLYSSTHGTNRILAVHSSWLFSLYSLMPKTGCLQIKTIFKKQFMLRYNPCSKEIRNRYVWNLFIHWIMSRRGCAYYENQMAFVGSCLWAVAALMTFLRSIQVKKYIFH